MLLEVSPFGVWQSVVEVKKVSTTDQLEKRVFVESQ
jgi:hypothetical protein